MESTTKTSVAEPFLKIDTIWSEAEENFENFTIKEEIVSDIEPDIKDIVEKNANDEVDNSGDNFKQSGENGKGCNSNFSSSVTSASRQVLRKRTKNKHQNLIIDDLELPNDTKSSCLHDTKSFKIVNRRLRCGDCRSLVCPECFKIMFSTLHNHFLGFDTSNCGLYSCKYCCFPFQSVCALQAHIRIHTMETPFVCPDCGLIYSNAYFLILHLINKCFHVYKIVSYKCQSCPGVYFTSETFLQHIQDLHLSCVFRCSYCSLLFNNSEEFNNHMDNSHQKQKVQYLNYFRCTLCSDMVIPSFMYEKHIDRHRENSESYEVEYQCLCGDVFSLIGAFRAHVQFCDKKGILPPHWGFLQKNFKIQDVTPIENCYGNEDTLTPELNSVTNITGDSQNFSKINSCRSNEHKIEDKEMLIEAGNSIKSDEKKGSLALVCHKNDVDVRNSSPKFTEIHILNNTKFDNKLIENSQKNDKDLDKIEDKCCASSTTSTNLGENNLPEIFNESSVHNEEKAVKTTKEDRNGKEVKEADVEVPKIFYDHIPCDHLGYLKTQGPEIFHKESASFEQKDASSLQNVDSQKLIMELDEKTGLMIPRKVNVNVSEEEDNSNIKENACEIDTEYFNCDDLFSKIHSNSKGKIKLGSSFFTCPFCIVLFPKHSSTFQQFRLHLEYYHTDAALNITVPSNEPCGEETNKIKTNNPTKDEKKRLSNMSFVKTQSASNIRKKSVGKKKKCPKLDSRNLETEDCLLENKQEVENTDQNEELRCKENKLYDESEKENITKEANLIVEKSNSRNNIYWTVKLSVKNNDLVEDENSELEKDNNITTCVDDECVDGSKNMRSDNAKVQETRANPANLNTVAVMQKVDCDNSKKFIFGLKNMSSGQNCDLMSEEKENGRSLRKDRADSLASLSKIEKNENFATNREKSDKIVKEVNASDFPGKKTEQTASDFDDDWENSKDSSWSNISDVELIAHQEEKIDLNYDFLARPKVVEKSRRESEVWSEFYESLQLAEKFKKSKKKELQSNGEANKKSPTLKDYSAKRIVKKPKRYRESSESECSFDENENSGSEAEFTIANQETENSKVNDQNNVQQDKRDKLLGKLKNVDQKLVDYLFDLITKKEKCLELYKKHTNFRVNRYSQDLRSYRKKILNGIKLRGRPLKLVRYQEVAKRDQAGAEKLEVFKRIGFQRSLKKNQDNKSSEKKRGRPRKILESAKLKERRRSDKEVNFIEKNFEREENGNSLSKRRRKLSSKLQYYKKINFSDEKDDFSSGQVITSKTTDSSKKFTCAVCKEVFPELNEFREHVVVHRLEENIYQCMECGECFVVRPSLEKHLHAFHKIKNTDRYITENQCCNPNREQVEPEAEILKENQCKVCKDQFERAIDLTKHFRIHGMAFLKEFKKDAKIKL